MKTFALLLVAALMIGCSSNRFPGASTSAINELGGNAWDLSDARIYRAVEQVNGVGETRYMIQQYCYIDTHLFNSYFKWETNNALDYFGSASRSEAEAKIAARVRTVKRETWRSK